MNKESPISSEDLKIYTLTNKKGTRLKILNLGATIFGLLIKDKNGKELNVVVGPKNPEDYISAEYLNENRCFGASIGRYAGRISNGEFELEGKKYSLFQKNGVHLHGGFRGLQHKIWILETENKTMNPSITLSCFSEDLEEGYPGNLKIQLKYTLSVDDKLEIGYSATTDKKTPMNITKKSPVILIRNFRPIDAAKNLLIEFLFNFGLISLFFITSSIKSVTIDGGKN